jgi:hypothetical protein
MAIQQSGMMLLIPLLLRFHYTLSILESSLFLFENKRRRRRKKNLTLSGARADDHLWPSC